MLHVHNIIDTDNHFVIDPITRTITTKADKLCIVQHDHDSERFTFQLPRYIEEHDMSLCDRIEIHYTNIIRNKKEQYDDVYIVPAEDCSFDHDTLFFSWLVSGNATRLVGSLKFSITFLCHDSDGMIIYEWGTALYENVQVLANNKNTDVVKERYPDLYNQLKQDILDSIPPCNGEVDVEEVEQIILEYFETNPLPEGEPGYSPTIKVSDTELGHNLIITDVNGTKTVKILDGTDGEDGVSPTVYTREIEGGYTITIIDANGPQTFNIMHGVDGTSEAIDYDHVTQIVDTYLEANPPVATITINGVSPDENGNINLDDIVGDVVNNTVDF